MTVDNYSMKNPPDHNPEVNQFLTASLVEDKPLSGEPYNVNSPFETIAHVVVENKTSHPPPNCPDGGQWGTISYIGDKTKSWACLACLCFGIPGLYVLLCPQDSKDAYKVNGNVSSHRSIL